MKKRVWLLLLPLFLGGALVGMRDVSRRRLDAEARTLDAEFRALIYGQASDGEKPGYWIWISKPGAKRFLGEWTPAQMKAALAEVRVQAARSADPTESGLALHFNDRSSYTRDTVHLYLALEDEENRIHNIDTSGDSRLERWNSYQLTPESVAALQKRVVAQYGKQIEAFKSPDWATPNHGKKP